MVAAATGTVHRGVQQHFLQFGAALDQGQPQEQKQRDGQQPVGQIDPGGHRTGHQAQGVEARQQQHVEQGQALEAQRIGQGDRGVEEEHRRKTCAHQAQGDGERQGQQTDQQTAGRAQRQAAGSQRAVALVRVAAVVGQVEQVVDQVGGRRAQAEGQKGPRRLRPARQRGLVGGQ